MFDPISYKKAKEVEAHLNRTYNMFNTRTLTVGKQIDQTTGDITDSPSHSLSDYIPVKPHTTYYVNKLCAVRRYDASGNYINGSNNITGAFNSMSATQIRLQILNGSTYEFQLTESDAELPYQEYGYRYAATDSVALDKDCAELAAAHDQSFVYDEMAKPFEIFDLLTDDAVVLPYNHSCVASRAYDVRWKDRPWSLMVAPTQATGRTRVTLPTSIDCIGITEFVLIAFVRSVIGNPNLGLCIGPWSRTSTILKNGWNIIRLVAPTSDISQWDTPMDCFYLDAYGSQSCTIYFARLVAIRRPKAQILLINDHGYSNFRNVAYPQLKSRGIPVTWAINPGRLGATITGTETILTQAEIDELAFDPMSEFSYHAWNPIEKASCNMTSEELLEEHHKCITYLRQNGILPQHYWRAAFTQNLAPAHAVLQPYLDAYATAIESAAINVYPFSNPYNVPRIPLHAATNTALDTMFEMLRKTHALYVCYTHGLDDAGGIHWTTPQMNYFLQKVDAGIAEGWLEGTTYSKLRGQYKFNHYAEIL